jgi:hypothetical protein
MFDDFFRMLSEDFDLAMCELRKNVAASTGNLTTNLVDVSEVAEVLNEVDAYSDRFPSAVIGLGEMDCSVLIEIEAAAVTADTMVTVLKPSSFLLGFVAALRLCANV